MFFFTCANGQPELQCTIRLLRLTRENLMLFRLAAAFLLLGFFVLHCRAESPRGEWNQWRGPSRDGKLTASVWPQQLGDSVLVETWSVPLQESYSGPVVNAQVVVTTETIDKQDEQVVALDRETGERRWSQRWKGAMRVPFFAASRGSWIRATPVIDEDTVYVGGVRGVVYALDVETGEVRWELNLVKNFDVSLPSFGFVSSPLVEGDAVYAQGGGGVVKLDRASGSVIWRSMANQGGMNGGAFSSPVVADVQGSRQLVVQGRKKLAGLSLDDGTVIWEHEVPAYRGMNILTPSEWQGQFFTSAYGGRTFLYAVENESDGFEVGEQWDNKLQGYMSSPILIDGHAYIHLRNRRFACVDLATGEEKWTTKPFGEYWSMVANDSLILALDERGELLLIRANPNEFELLDRRSVTDESAWAHLAVDGDQIFVRSLKHLIAFKWAQP